MALLIRFCWKRRGYSIWSDEIPSSEGKCEDESAKRDSSNEGCVPELDCVFMICDWGNREDRISLRRYISSIAYPYDWTIEKISDMRSQIWWMSIWRGGCRSALRVRGRGDGAEANMTHRTMYSNAIPIWSAMSAPRWIVPAALRGRWPSLCPPDWNPGL